MEWTFVTTLMTIDPGIASVIVGMFVLMASVINVWQGGRIHALVNSNFTEQKAIIAALRGDIETMKKVQAARDENPKDQRVNRDTLEV